MNTNSYERALSVLRLADLAATFPVSDDGPPVSTPTLVSSAIHRATSLTVIQIDEAGRLLDVTATSPDTPAGDAHQTADAVTGVLLPSATSVVVARPQRADVTVDREVRSAMLLACRLNARGVSLLDYILVSPSRTQRYSMASAGAL